MENAENFKWEDQRQPAWLDSPPPGEDRLPFVVVYPKWRRPVTCAIVGLAVVGVMLHWYGRRSGPCWGSACKFDHMRQAPRWHGYLAIALRSVSRPCILGVSEYAYRELTALADVHNGLRGLVLRVERESDAEDSKVLVHLMTEGKVKHLPEPFDIRPLLLQMWTKQKVMPEAFAAAAEGWPDAQNGERLRQEMGKLFSLPGGGKEGVA
jgi:hypothetical protein